MTATAVEHTFSALLRSSTVRAHGTASSSRIVSEMLSGRLERERFAKLTMQYHAVYSVLEQAAETMKANPIAGALVRPELARTAALEADLAFLAGPDWRNTLPVIDETARYCERLGEVAFTWPGGFVAHHYVRYMGDLSGGAIISKKVAAALGLDRQGIEFYLFDGIPDADSFKNGYRATLDLMPFDTAEREKVVNEALKAYELNTAVLAAV
jgi:heme oxygenase